MKRLLSLISFLLAISALSCNNPTLATHDVVAKDSSKTEPDSSHVKITMPPLAQDTPRAAKYSAKPKTVGNESEVKNDTVKSSVNARAIIHHLPNQEKIDSIRKTKQKTTNQTAPK